VKRNWFNWFGKEAAQPSGAPRRRRLGAGFELIEPRLLMARGAIAFEIAPRDAEWLNGDASLVDSEIDGYQDGRDKAEADVPGVGDRHDDSNLSAEVGGFIDIGWDEPDVSGGGLGTSQIDEAHRDGFDPPQTWSDLPPGETGVDSLLTPPMSGTPSGTDPFDSTPFDGDPLIDAEVADPFEEAIGTTPIGTTPADPLSAGPELTDPFLPGPCEPEENLDPLGPSTNFDPGSGFQGGDEFGFPTRQPDRLPTPLPDSDNEQGGAIDITPSVRVNQEDESITLPRQSSTRSAVDGERTPLSVTPKTGAAENSLRASRGEAQAFELATSNWRRDRLAVQRVAPPKPDELPQAHQVIAAANQTGDEEQSAEAAASARQEPSELAELAAMAAEEVVTQLSLLLPLRHGLIDQLLIPSVDGESTDSQALTGDCAMGGGSRALGGLELVHAGQDEQAQQPTPVGDHDTAARMVGAGLIVIAGHAGAIYFQPERPQAQRTFSRDWELQLERKRS
jgi:hypothetical protein